MAKRDFYTFILAILFLIGPFAIPVNAYQVSDNNDKICRYHTDMQERLNHIPKNLLTAISITESGRWNRNKAEIVAWPWTVTARGEGKFYPSKPLAIAAVKELQAQGVQNIDVGCMQVNLYYHPEAFDSLESAFDPQTNVEYSAAFLTRLFKDNRSWNRAAASYHSGELTRGTRYMEKVLGLWNEIQRDEPLAQSPRVKEQDPIQVVGLDIDRTKQINDFIKARRNELNKKAPTNLSPTTKGLMGTPPEVGKPKGKSLQDYRNQGRS